MRRDAYTLIELLMSIIIIGIVASVAIPRLASVARRSSVAAVQSDLHNLRVAQEMYYQTHDFTYADSVDDLLEAGFFRPSSKVEIEIDQANAMEWEASATHRSADAACGFHSSSNLMECSYRGRAISGSTNETILTGPSSE